MTGPDAGGRYGALVLGGYGFFGTLLARRLARDPRLRLVLAGRDAARAQAVIDITRPGLAQSLAAQGCGVVVHTAGPFQGQDYRVAEACIDAGLHYVDLADGRDFVCGIGKLDAQAKARGVLVTSGASSVPALSGAAVDHLARQLDDIDAIEIGISPGNRTERGLATMQAILGYCGAPIAIRHDGRPLSVIGWQGLKRHRFPPPIGARLLGHCDVPDLALLPQRFPGVRSVIFRAGLELEFLQRGMWLMAATRRLGLVRDWSRHAGALLAAGRWFMRFGTDAGGMYVAVTDAKGRRRTWTLIAERGDGPFVPTLAAAALVGKLARDEIAVRGAMPCLGLLSLADFAPAMGGLAIRTGIDEH